MSAKSANPYDSSFFLSRIVRALMREYDRVYCVDLHDDTYMQYRPQGPKNELHFFSPGEDFFSHCRADIKNASAPKMRKKCCSRFKKKTWCVGWTRKNPFRSTAASSKTEPVSPCASTPFDCLTVRISS